MVENEMNGWDFENANPIANFTVTLELAAPINPTNLRDIANKHPLFKRDLPRRQEHPLVMLPMIGNPIPQQAQIAGVVFDSVSTDGSVARSLNITFNQISYMSANYSRWKEFQPVFERLFSDIIRLLSSPPSITAITLAVTNRFQWKGDHSSSNLGTLLNVASNLFAPNMVKTNEHCHSFHGYIERSTTPAGQYIRNVNIQTGDLEGNKVATVLLSHRLALETPIGPDSNFFSGEASAHGSKITSEMRKANNEVFAALINPSISSRIQGMPVT